MGRMSQPLPARRFLYCLLQGEAFSPSLAQARTGLLLVDANEPGEVAPSGRYEGRALPYGSAMLVLLDEDLEPGVSALEPLRRLKARLPELRSLGATGVSLYLVVAYERQCDFVLAPEELAELAALGLPLAVSCHPAAT
ncbi:hypothetical protein ATI61_106535 [Archangium gephyra]|uniref:Uncharacterized protein n=2 Tax=Archangium gephyra TaxID=48 RepID=A0AAC8TAP5_9BACT|nr:Hypothetical protein AA314_00786 [Archangium gephyra]REG31065.1 hypothetical protein ATI61_106535 [Archangium gephyra]